MMVIREIVQDCSGVSRLELAAPWTALGHPRGRGRMDRHCAWAGEAPKTILVNPVDWDAQWQLRER